MKVEWSVSWRVNRCRTFPAEVYVQRADAVNPDDPKSREKQRSQNGPRRERLRKHDVSSGEVIAAQIGQQFTSRRWRVKSDRRWNRLSNVDKKINREDAKTGRRNKRFVFLRVFAPSRSSD
jgi:hypothetical protein